MSGIFVGWDRVGGMGKITGTGTFLRDVDVLAGLKSVPGMGNMLEQ
jgi:hypothetical protein